MTVDLALNLPTVISLITMVFVAGRLIGKFETRISQLEKLLKADEKRDSG